MASDENVTARQVFSRFASYYRPYRKIFFLDLLCATVLAAIDLAFPQFLNFFTGDFFLRDSAEVLGALGEILAFFVVLYLVRTACQYYITSWGHVMGASMERDMRADLFEQYQRMSFSYFDRNGTGSMMSKLMTDLFDISELAHHGPENLFICTLKIVGSFVLVGMINMSLMWIMVAATAVMAVYAVWKNYIRRTIFRENRERMADLSDRVQDSLGGIRVVKTFGNEAGEERKFERINEAYTDTKRRGYRFLGSFQAANSLYQGALYTIIIVGGGYFAATGAIRATDLAIYALYVGIFISPVEQLINFAEMFQKGYAGFRRFLEVLALKPDVVDAIDARPLPELALPRADREALGNRVPGAVRYRHVSFSYDKKVPVLQDFDLSIPAGETVALVGPSGGGKTTACSLLPRFYDVDEGSIEIDGVDVRAATLDSLRRCIGFVQQDVYLFNASIRENIAYGRPDATDEEIIEAAKRANIHDFVMTLPQGYDTIVGERGARLSGGEKQRVSIARIFLRDPSILVLDEATSALDNESERAVQGALAELARGRTTIIIAHRLSTIRSAGTIAVVEDGHVAEKGTHRELMDKGGTYARYYQLQFGDEV